MVWPQRCRRRAGRGGLSNRLKPLQRLEGAQADASHPRRQVWLSASAGTGKTHVLTARVLRLLLGGADPSAILCLTFTKAGAAEMSERIQQRLAGWVDMREQDLRKELFALGEAHGQDELRAARRLFARVLDAAGGGLRIQTIHAFAQTLLAGFPAEAGLAPGFRPLEGRAEAALQRATLGRMLVEAERGGDLGLIRDVQALSHRFGEQKAESYLRLCARAPDAMAALGSREGIEARVRTALDVLLGDIEARIAEACHDDAFDCAGLRSIAAANAAWATKQGGEHAAAAHGFLQADPPARAAMLEDLLRIAVTKEGTARVWSTKLLGCDPDHGDNCARLAEAVGALVGQRRRAATAGLIAAGLRAGQAYAQAYAAAKRQAGAVDFDDLIRLTVRLLGRPGIGAWIRYKLDRRTDHVLIDEGQDTNTRQWAIVSALADEFFAEEPRENAADATHTTTRTIFSVGDFKQAIFGFQGTDPMAFEAARAFFERAAEGGGQRIERHSLDKSFRSTPPVLAVVDRLLADVGEDALGLFDPLEPHESAKPRLPGSVTLWRPVSLDTATDEEGGEEGWIDDATRLFATKLAEQVRDWLRAGLWLPAAGRTLRPEDVLILCRKRGALASLIVARLHEERVPVAGVDRLRLDAPLAVKDLVAAMRFAIQPEDDLNLASLLVAPLIGLDQDELYRVAFGRRGSLWSALGDHPAATALRDLLNAADFATPHAFLERILSGAMDGRRRLLARLGVEARDPIEELVNAALAFEREATPTLQTFLDWFDRGEVVIARDPSAPLDAVRVMTVHGAKGLQAPLVILADATGDPDASPGGDLVWPIDEEGDPVPVPRPRKADLVGTLAEVEAAQARREKQEHWRLLYVAATRAEEMLLIGGALGPRAKGSPSEASWYAALDRALAGLGAEQQADPHWGSLRRYAGEIAAPAERSRPRRAVELVPATPLPTWVRAPAPQEARPPRPLAPSSLGEDDVADPPPSPALRAAARRGRLLHALFERLPAVAAADRDPAARRWLLGPGGVEDPAIAQAIAADACAIIADPALVPIFSAAALAEAPIAAVIEGGHVVAGTVDRLLVEDDRVRLVDFKTGRRVPLDLEDAPVHHLRQMAAYAAALAVIFPGRRIEAALLYTAGPRLLPLSPEDLARHKPGLGEAQQKLGAER